MNSDELGSVREGRLDLHVVYHLGDAWHNLIAAQHLGARLHQVGDAAPVPGALDHEIGDQRHRFRMVQLDASLQTAAGDHGSHADQQLVFLSWGQVHSGHSIMWSA